MDKIYTQRKNQSLKYLFIYTPTFSATKIYGASEMRGKCLSLYYGYCSVSLSQKVRMILQFVEIRLVENLTTQIEDILTYEGLYFLHLLRNAEMIGMDLS